MVSYKFPPAVEAGNFLTKRWHTHIIVIKANQVIKQDRSCHNIYTQRVLVVNDKFPPTSDAANVRYYDKVGA